MSDKYEGLTFHETSKAGSVLERTGDLQGALEAYRAAVVYVPTEAGIPITEAARVK